MRPFRWGFVPLFALALACSGGGERTSALRSGGAGGRPPVADNGGSGGGSDVLPGGGAGAGGGGGGPGPMPPNAISAENELPGDPAWDDGKAAPAGELEGYADRISAMPGDTVELHLSSRTPAEIDWVLYRFGWYGGDGARAVARGSAGLVEKQEACPVAKGTGLVRCSWPATESVQIPSDAVSGLHAFKLLRADGRYSWIPLVIGSDRPSALLFQSSVTTWQAYNEWGGTSLYKDRVGNTDFGRAVAVSFDRPFAEGDGAGQLFRWEIHFARFLERFGYDVAYTTNLDVERAPLAQHRAFLSVGHDEYWNLGERRALEQARDAGVSLLFFAANTGYWKIRFADPGAGGKPRTMISYKGDAPKDPEQGEERTGNWRLPPISQPEQALLGVMYESWMRFSQALVVSDASHWVYEGTGLQTGDALPALVGYEYDRTFPDGPAGIEVVARSPVVDIAGIPGLSEAAVHWAPSGALIFASGTIDWSLGLAPGPLFDPRLERITANVIAKAAALPVPLGMGSDTGPAAPELEGELAAEIDAVARDLPPISSVTALPDGSLAAADPRGNRVIRIADGGWSVLAGDGAPGALAGVPGAQARFRAPTAVAADRNGNVLVADTGNHCIRKILADPAHTVVPLAGACETRGMQDGGPAAARFDTPMGLAFDPVCGDLLVADAGNDRIRAVQPGNGTVRTRAGGGSDAGDGPAAATILSFPTAVAADDAGNVYVVETGYQRVRVIRGTQVTTLVRGGAAGLRDGDGGNAQIAAQGGAAWIGGSLFVADPAGRSIRRVVVGTDAASTRVRTFATDLGLPLGLAAGPGGVLLAVDAGAGAVLRLRP